MSGLPPARWTLRRQARKRPEEADDLRFRVSLARPADPDELDQVHPALPGLDPAHEVLFPPQHIGELPLRQARAFAQIHQQSHDPIITRRKH